MKNNLVGGLEDRQVKYLGSAHEGKKHDKKICDEEGTRLPAGAELYRDSAFQGHELPGVTAHQPKKKPRGGELSAEDKEANRLVSSIRVVIEHIISGIKRCRIVKDVFRNTEGAQEVRRPPRIYGLHPVCKEKIDFCPWGRLRVSIRPFG